MSNESDTLETLAELRAQVGDEDNVDQFEAVRAGIKAKRKPLVGSETAFAILLISAGIVMVFFAGLDPEGTFAAFGTFLAGIGIGTRVG